MALARISLWTFLLYYGAMAEYATKAPGRRQAGDASRTASSAPPHTARTQALAQLRGALNQSPRVAQLEQFATVLQKRAGAAVEGEPRARQAQNGGQQTAGVIQPVFTNDDGDRVMTTSAKNTIMKGKWSNEKVKSDFIDTFKSEDEETLTAWTNDLADKESVPDFLWDVLASQYDGNEEHWEAKPEEETEQLVNERNNVEKAIRAAAQRVTTPDSSGHGGGKTIPKGMKGDKHEKGQRRKDTRKKALSNTLEDLLAHYAELDGDETTLDPSTKKLLKEAGWKVPKLEEK